MVFVAIICHYELGNCVKSEIAFVFWSALRAGKASEHTDLHRVDRSGENVVYAQDVQVLDARSVPLINEVGIMNGFIESTAAIGLEVDLEISRQCDFALII
jgi:hypothetical protein